MRIGGKEFDFAMLDDPQFQADRRKLMRARSLRVQDIMMDIAEGADEDPLNPVPWNTRLAAASKINDIVEGTPVSRTIIATTADLEKLSHGELAAELARLAGTEARYIEGDAPEGDTD